MYALTCLFSVVSVPVIPETLLDFKKLVESHLHMDLLKNQR